MTELVETTSKLANNDALTTDETQTLKMLKGEINEESNTLLSTPNTSNDITFKDLVIFRPHKLY